MRWPLRAARPPLPAAAAARPPLARGCHARNPPPLHADRLLPTPCLPPLQTGRPLPPFARHPVFTCPRASSPPNCPPTRPRQGHLAVLDPDVFKFNWKHKSYKRVCGGEAEVRFVEWHLPPSDGTSGGSSDGSSQSRGAGEGSRGAGEGSSAGGSGPTVCPIQQGRRVALKIHHASNGHGGFWPLIDEVDVQEEGGPAACQVWYPSCSCMRAMAPLWAACWKQHRPQIRYHPQHGTA